MLCKALGDIFDVWMKMREYASSVYPKATEEWNFPGRNYGWSFRIKDKKRAIIYMLPRDKYFLVEFVFGVKATNEALTSEIPHDIKTIIESAKVYAEGRGFRIEVRNESIMAEIKKLIDLKLKY
jgi:hypothetical protein